MAANRPPVEPEADAKAVLERRANFDAATWESALAQKAQMASRSAPTQDRPPWPPPPPTSPAWISISPPAEPIELGQLQLTGKATGGFSSGDHTWNGIDDISVQVDGAAQPATWRRAPGDPVGRVTWWATVPIPSLGLHTILAILTASDGSTAQRQIIINATVDPFRWRDVGPANLSGCVLQVIVDPGNNDCLYAATSDGGVWRLDSVAAYPGAPWVPLTDWQPSLAVGSVAVARSDNRVVYYADALQYVYRSTDRGATWSRPAATKIGGVYKLIVHPDDPDTVYAATTTGLWFTGDGGANWSNLNAGKITDLAMDPADSSILYVGKPGTGVLKTYNSGWNFHTVLDWSKTNASWPMIKLAVGALGTEKARTVAAKLNEEVWVNHAGGRNGVGPTGWVLKGSLAEMGQWDWDHAIAIDPFDDNIILVGAIPLYRTVDGGTTWNRVVQSGGGDPTHEDQQSIAFDATTAGTVYLSNDGGVWRSTDTAQTWATGDVAADIAARRNLNQDLVTAQFYRAGARGNHALGDVYHSGIIGSPDLAGRGWVGVEGHAWEFSEVYADPRRDQYFVIAGTLGRRRWPSTGTNDYVIPWGSPSFTPGGGGLTSAVHSVASDPRPASNTVLAGTQNPGRIMRGDGSSDAPTWTAMPGISIGDQPIVSIDFAPSFPGRAYAISQWGSLFRKDDVNDDVRVPGWSSLGQLASPTGSELRQIAVNAQDADKVYAITGQEIFRWTPTLGWMLIQGSGSTGLPSSPRHSLVVDPRLPSTIYLGTEVGIFFSSDDGATWNTFSEFLPNVVIGQIFWDSGYLYATTFGRGLWRRRAA